MPAPSQAAQPDSGRQTPPDQVTGLVTRVRNGEQQAWDAMVERYAPLIWSICRRYQLEAADAAQAVWLNLVEHLDSLRDPAALPGWPPPPGANAPASRAPPGDPATPGMRRPPGPSRPTTPRRPGRTCLRPNGTRPCGRRPGRCRRAASTCSPCSPATPAVLRRDQRPAGHPGQQHRGEPPPLPGQAPPPPGHHRANQRRHLARHAPSMTAANRKRPSSPCCAFPADPPPRAAPVPSPAHTRRIPDLRPQDSDRHRLPPPHRTAAMCARR
jgi:hypothetical protein